ncbi:hypothetical protein CRG98_025511 [Punica granatum]|uniref:Uncharacterized protein n=1 Tax=Punica granatum TaxID=22663 RepID=A0A2I0JCW7_PUNGR|nr:hypothetical protein CRG98_025511 [Punica granatum]
MGRRWLRRERQLTVAMRPRAKGRWVITAVVAREAARLVAKAQSRVDGRGSMRKARTGGGRAQVCSGCEERVGKAGSESRSRFGTCWRVGILPPLAASFYNF